MTVDFSDLRHSRKPTKKERGRYKAWVKYLKNSKLSEEEIYRRAEIFALQGRSPSDA